MKKFLFFLGLFSLVTLTSWKQNDISNEVPLSALNMQDAWLNAKLDNSFAVAQKAVNGYTYSLVEIQSLLSQPNFSKLRFVLGFSNGIIQIEAQAIDNKGDYIKGESGDVLYSIDSNGEVNKLASAFMDINKSDPTLKTHLLQPNQAYNYVANWKVALNNISKFDEVVSYSNQRIRYFFIDRMVIEDLVASKQATKICALVGLNSERKMTIALTTLNGNNEINLAEKGSDEGILNNGLYDFCGHCPTVCD